MTLACEDANSKRAEVVNVADFDAEKSVDNSLVQIWKLKLNFHSDSEHNVWSRI